MVRVRKHAADGIATGGVFTGSYLREPAPDGYLSMSIPANHLQLNLVPLSPVPAGR
jgi:hypothetical protein